MNNEQLIKRIEVLEAFVESLKIAAFIPLEVEQALKGRGFVKNFQGLSVFPVSIGGTGASTLTGILKGTGVSPITAISPLAGGEQFYVADGSGGAVNRRLTFTDGILTSKT